MAKKKRFVKIDITKPQREVLISPMLSKEQMALQEMFGGSERLWGTGRDLPRMNGALISGGGIIKSGDAGETAAMFGGY